MSDEDPFVGAPSKPLRGFANPKVRAAAVEGARRKREARRAGARSDEPRSTPNAPATKGADPADEGKLREFETSTAAGLAKLGVLATPYAPVPGVYVAATAEVPAAALTRLARRHPAMLAALGALSEGSDVATVLAWGMGLAYAVRVQMGAADGHNVIAERLGVKGPLEEAIAAGVIMVPEPGEGYPSPDDGTAPGPQGSQPASPPAEWSNPLAVGTGDAVVSG